MRPVVPSRDDGRTNCDAAAHAMATGVGIPARCHACVTCRQGFDANDRFDRQDHAACDGARSPLDVAQRRRTAIDRHTTLLVAFALVCVAPIVRALEIVPPSIASTPAGEHAESVSHRIERTSRQALATIGDAPDTTFGTNRFDADGDGVGDTHDACPYTSYGQSVDTLGCMAVPDELAILRYDADDPVALSAVLRAQLATLAATLRQHADIEVTIEGHTDDRGEPEPNARLSRRWASLCADYVGRLGVSPGRLHVAGYGESRPRVAGDSTYARQLNRRIEVRRLR